MSNHLLHKRALTLTRFLVALLMLVTIWTGSQVVATIGTLIWVYMPQVVKLEERLYRYIEKKRGQ